MEAVGVGLRAVAIIIDTILMMIVGYIIASVAGSTGSEGFELSGAPMLLLILIGTAYFVVMEKVSGATLGKMAVKIKVVKQDGQPLDWKASIIRNLLRIIDGQLIYLVGAIVVWVSKGNQRLG